MSGKHGKAIREILTTHPDGLTVPEISGITGMDGRAISYTVNADEMIYIDRWKLSESSPQWVAVWRLHPPLVNTERPSIKPGEYRKRMELA